MHQGAEGNRRHATSGAADVGIATEGLDESPEIATFPFYRWHHAVIVRKDHPLLRAGAVTLEALSEYPIITYHEGFTGRAHVDKAFADAGIVPDIVLSAIDADVIKTYVDLDPASASSPRWLTMRTRTAISLIPVPELFPSNTTRLAVRRGTTCGASCVRLHREGVPGCRGGGRAGSAEQTERQ